ncbi:MAG: hypothetical protein ACE5EV_04570 [Gaiellales bacterium]
MATNCVHCVRHPSEIRVGAQDHHAVGCHSIEGLGDSVPHILWPPSACTGADRRNV